AGRQTERRAGGGRRQAAPADGRLPGHQAELQAQPDRQQRGGQVLNRQTNEVIREIPPENIRRLADRMAELNGLLFDSRA
ncbi:MAG: flagellar protein FlaG, partial [Proteobacteria bacterium]|nr:flagellar protein FlaG [Pseudomonadota bacterium]